MSCQIKTAVKVVQGPLFFEQAKRIILSDLKKKLRNVWKSTHDFLAWKKSTPQINSPFNSLTWGY